MTDTSALSSTGSLFVANGVMDVPPTVARRPHSQDARRRWRIARSIAWATQMRCLQTPSHHGALAASPSSPRPRRACGRTQTRPAVPYAVRPYWERGGAAQRTGTHVSTALETTEKCGNMCIMRADAPLFIDASMPNFQRGSTQQSKEGRHMRGIRLLLCNTLGYMVCNCNL